MLDVSFAEPRKKVMASEALLQLAEMPPSNLHITAAFHRSGGRGLLGIRRVGVE